MKALYLKAPNQFEVRDVELDCQKLKGKWKISGVKLKAVIKR